MKFAIDSIPFMATKKKQGIFITLYVLASLYKF